VVLPYFVQIPRELAGVTYEDARPLSLAKIRRALPYGNGRLHVRPVLVVTAWELCQPFRARIHSSGPRPTASIAATNDIHSLHMGASNHVLEPFFNPAISSAALPAELANPSSGFGVPVRREKSAGTGSLPATPIRSSLFCVEDSSPSYFPRLTPASATPCGSRDAPGTDLAADRRPAGGSVGELANAVRDLPRIRPTAETSRWCGLAFSPADDWLTVGANMFISLSCAVLSGGLD